MGGRRKSADAGGVDGNRRGFKKGGGETPAAARTNES